MKFLIPFIALSFILLFNTSCQEFNEVVLHGTKILESINYYSDPLSTYEYDEEGRISKIDIYSLSSSDPKYFISYTYEKDIVTKNYISNRSNLSFTTPIHKIYKTDQNTVRFDRYNSNNVLVSYRIYHYNGNPCGYSEIKDYGEDGTMLAHSTYSYYNINCSQDIHHYNDNDSLVARVRIERDNKQLYFASTRLDILQQGDLGNITKYTYMDGDSVINPNLSYSMVYIYNDGHTQERGTFPIAEYKQYDNGELEQQHFEYTNYD